MASFQDADIATSLMRKALAEKSVHPPNGVMLCNLDNVHACFTSWKASMPNVRPYYAVKCNDDPHLLRLLSMLGAGFDCASPAEIEAVLAAGATADDVVYAHPCKRVQDISFAHERGVKKTTFDSPAEVDKLAQFPGMQAILRIHHDDVTSWCPLGNKYGALECEWPSLISAALKHNIPIVGVSFHIGSGSRDTSAYIEAVCKARRCWDALLAAGFTPSILDIGGGFVVSNHASGFGVPGMPPQTAADVRAALRLFDDVPHVAFIAEPGRYFAEAYMAYAVQVVGLRERQGVAMCWLSDGLYGCLNLLFHDEYLISPSPLDASIAAGPKMPTVLVGPTCDSFDVFPREQQLPALPVGSWLLFPHVGAYSTTCACDFNGVQVSRDTVKVYVHKGAIVDAAAALLVATGSHSRRCSLECCDGQLGCQRRPLAPEIAA